MAQRGDAVVGVDLGLSLLGVGTAYGRVYGLGGLAHPLPLKACDGGADGALASGLHGCGLAYGAC